MNPSQLLYISLSFGLSLLVCAWTFFRVSGGLFVSPISIGRICQCAEEDIVADGPIPVLVPQNPAVSLGLALVGGITPVRAVILIASQMLGAIAGCGLVKGLLGNLYART